MTAITNAETFALHVQSEVSTKHISYLEAIVTFCQERDLEPQSIVPFIDAKMRSELQREGIALHLLKKTTNALPLE